MGGFIGDSLKEIKRTMGDDCRHRCFFPIALAQLSPVRHSKLSGAKQQISSCCALSKVTEFLQNRKIWGEIAALWLHTACVMTSDVCSKKLWSIGFGVDCWRALRCACKYGPTAYQVKLGLAWTRKLAFPCASPLWRVLVFLFLFLERRMEKAVEEKNESIHFLLVNSHLCC